MEAVEDKVGGDNPALAQEIAREHPCASGIASLIYRRTVCMNVHLV